MTESEAKTKWCPMVRYQDLRAINRDACYDNSGTHCIGSACMMWRHLVNTKEGYCGLAGKP